MRRSWVRLPLWARPTGRVRWRAVRGGYCRPVEGGQMDTTLILLQGAVVIIAILLGVRMGGIGLGLWGLVGLAVLVFGFGLAPGEPPTSSMFIILMVITAASTMQAVGGIDYLVEVAKSL